MRRATSDGSEHSIRFRSLSTPSLSRWLLRLAGQPVIQIVQQLPALRDAVAEILTKIVGGETLFFQPHGVEEQAVVIREDLHLVSQPLKLERQVRPERQRDGAADAWFQVSTAGQVLL